MSWSRRRTLGYLLVAAPAMASGCGLRPLYGTRAEGPSVQNDLADISLRRVRAREPRYDRLGQILHNNLLDRINPAGRPRDPRYRLVVSLNVAREQTGIQITEQATRARLLVYANFTLSDIRTGKTLTAGSDRSINSFNILDSQYAALSAERDAEKRAVREIADSIHARLAIYFDRQRPEER
jgi:LPS-assembly lipoprotein